MPHCRRRTMGTLTSWKISFAKIPYLRLVGRCEVSHGGHTLILKKKRSDLVLLDIKMPDLSGIQFLEDLTQKASGDLCDGLPWIRGRRVWARCHRLPVETGSLRPFCVDRKQGLVNMSVTERTNHHNGKMISFIKTAHKIQKLFYHDIVYLEGLKDYTGIHRQIARNPSLHSKASNTSKPGCPTKISSGSTARISSLCGSRYCIQKNGLPRRNRTSLQWALQRPVV